MIYLILSRTIIYDIKSVDSTNFFQEKLLIWKRKLEIKSRVILRSLKTFPLHFVTFGSPSNCLQNNKQNKTKNDGEVVHLRDLLIFSCPHRSFVAGNFILLTCDF